MTRTLSKYIPQLTGWQAVLAFLLGAFVLYTAGRLMWANITFSATGGVEMTGGQVLVDQSNVWSPAVKVTKGGVVGLELAMLGGALFSVIQIIFWLTTESAEGGEDEGTDDDEDASLIEKAWMAVAAFKRNPFPLVFGLSMCADILERTT